jgi:hypothetical protein
MYTEYGAPVSGRGTSVESTDVNWKTTQDPSLMYIYYPIKRPVPLWNSTLNDWDYGNTSDITTSVSVNNYFRITGVTGKVVEPNIIICSPHLTKIKIITKPELETQTWNPLILYAGSGWANGLEFHEKVGALFADNTYTLQHTMPDSLATGEEWHEDYLVINDQVCARINKLTGSADKIIHLSGQTWAETTTLNSTDGSDIGTETTSEYHELSAKSTYLFAGLSNTYSEPTSAMINNLRFVSNGNLTIPVALSSSPLIAGTKQDEYTGADLYSPYIVSQLRLAAAKYDDVGNSPQYRILFSCKVYN